MRKIRAVAVSLALCLLCLLTGCADRDDPPLLEIICLDVGQGSSTLLRTAEGDILIDAGGEETQAELCRRLQSLGVTELKLLLFSHPDEDHMGGGDGVLEQCSVRELRINQTEEPKASERRLLDTAAKQEIPCGSIREGDSFSIGGVRIAVLSPHEGATYEGNNKSLVLMVYAGETSFLLMGDAGETVEVALLERYGAENLKAEILLAGHHGANDASSAAFLQAVSPRAVLISCGAANAYGHPDGRAVERMKNAGATVWRTDLSGEIAISVYETDYILKETIPQKREGKEEKA